MTTATAVTDAMWGQYADDGYFVTDVLFDGATLSAMRDAFERRWHQGLEAAKRDGNAQRIRLMRDRPFLSDMSGYSDICREALRHPVLLDIARHIVGNDIDVTYDQAVIKAPRAGNDEVVNHFGWHQDAYYPTHGANPQLWDREKLLNLNNGFMGWIAVTRATIDNGCLWAVPGKHREGLLPHVFNETQREWDAQFDKSSKQPLELEPGQMLIFTPLTPHASGPNVTDDQTRMAYQFGFATPGTCKLSTVVPVLRGGELVH